ncbi:MAG: 16S rRNA (guanine(966)-N(2))-methyltransferase RsmD [Candidatus Hydrogenedentes bacterium]|jgi:16S rRNA (guanine966-N2)-methyltransferase|nr:16S rRNA (guanine(966)-N(2))-methyltransferase RsmD [Candidatus Hydrogenedentota bacterium]
MRVIAGLAKGRNIEMPKDSDLRPTKDKVREALFSILHERLPGCAFLDLYAGTGANGIEALSRGARSCVFVDADRRCTRVIGKNLQALGLESGADIRSLTLPEGVQKLKDGGLGFNIIFADPSYGYGDLLELQREIVDGEILAESGCLIIEHSSRMPLDDIAEGLELTRDARYGESSLAFLRAWRPHDGGKLGERGEV